MRPGVLALQGDVREHTAVLAKLGYDPTAVRTPFDLEKVDALVIPGGESTAILNLITLSHLKGPLTTRLSEGMPVLGTCAGLIVLASEVLDGRADQWSFGALDVTVRRNGYGRQIASFETPITLSSGVEIPGVFIRAPRMTRVGDAVEVLATHDHGDGEHPVLVRQGNVFGCSFHPELTSNTVIHELFLSALR
jgi:5'-phosphate synthase pdxT subunit